MVKFLRSLRPTRIPRKAAAVAIATGLVGVALGGAGVASAEGPQPTAVSNVEVVTSSGTWRTTATCPGSKTVIGGGAHVNVDQGAAVEASRPSSTNRSGWYARATTGQATLTAWAICATVT